MIWTKNEYSRLVKFPILPQNSKISKSFQHALEVIINIVDINLQVPITYRFRNLTYLVILTKNVYFRLVKLPVFTQKSRNFQNRFNIINILDTNFQVPIAYRFRNITYSGTQLIQQHR